MVSKDLEDLKRLAKIPLTGAISVESASLLPISGRPARLITKIPGFVGIGVAGVASNESLRLTTGKRKRKRR